MLDPLHQLALETIQLKKQALIFAPSRASTEKMAEDLAKLVSENLPELEQKILHAGSVPTKQCRKLSQCIRKGLAFHHAGLLSAQRELIEDEFRSGKIKIICATPTLAAGMSLPAFRVIIKSLKRYSGEWGMDWIPVLEYLQMAGRAGRPEYEQWGEAITLAKDEQEKAEIYHQFICGVPEDISSKLAVEPVLRTYLLSLISSGVINDEKTMKEFFGRTFWAHQYADRTQLNKIMDKMLALLQEWEFVAISGNKEQQGEFVTAANLKKKMGEKTEKESEKTMNATRLGKRISELYLDPLTARHLADSLANFTTTKTVFSLIQMIAHTLEMRPLLRTKKKEQDLVQEELVKRYGQLLLPEPSVDDLDYDSFFNSIKTALFFEDWISEKDEDFLMEKYDVRPGEIRVKLEIADWLLYSAEELAGLLDYREIVTELRKLRMRVKDGVKEELLPLLKLKGIGRVRGRKLYSNGIKDLGDVKKADLTTLSQILGRAIAQDVQQQVGEELKKVPDGRRSGQLSIRKYG